MSETPASAANPDADANQPASQEAPMCEPPPPDESPWSVSRPMSEAERAELEEVYRERGCGGECD